MQRTLKENGIKCYIKKVLKSIKIFLNEDFEMMHSSTLLILRSLGKVTNYSQKSFILHYKTEKKEH